MKKWVAFLFICCLTNNFSQTNISPQFSELKGMEDQQGNTHLFYRIYSEAYGINTYSRNNDIYRLSLSTLVDTIFLHDWLYSSPVMESAKFVYDYDFWNENYNEYIYCGMFGFGPEPIAYIERFDGNTNYYQWGEVDDLDISRQNDSMIYAGGDIFSALERSVRSMDGGWNWVLISDSLKFLSLTPFDDNLFFLESLSGFLYRSTDAGNTFHLVDIPNQPAHSTSFLYDPDQLHVYRSFGNQTLRVSSNKGEQFSWQTKYSSDSEIFISNDESISGTIYLADKKNILMSTNYGDNFSIYKTLDRKIVGIYKKPNSNKLYAASKYKIYEITPDTIQIIKSLPIPEEVLNYYPLTIGDKWVFHHSTVTYDPYPNYSYQIDVKEVLGDTIAPNGKRYYKVKDETIWESNVLERVDTSDGKVYRYYEDQSLPENEYVAYDLLAEVGDTISSFRLGFNTVMFTTMYAEATFEKWGLTKPKKVFEEYTLHPPIFSLTRDIGLDSIYFYFDFGETYIYLKGCIIDGIVYGDTTTVGVEDEKNPIATDFKLEQNYPNPFNPKTVISYQLPVSSSVTLKVYDILGNEITTLVNEEKPAGEYEVTFDSHSGNVRNLTSGIYFYQLKAGSFVKTMKMVYLK